MKKKLLLAALVVASGISYAQIGNYFRSTSKKPYARVSENKVDLKDPKLYELDIEGLKSALKASPEKMRGRKSEVIVSFPNSEGEIESFRVYENSNFAPELAAKYPEIKSYIGENIEKNGSNIFFSISPLGLSTMELNADKSSVFIEPYTKDQKIYSVYKKNQREGALNKWECSVVEDAKKSNAKISNTLARPNADDSTLRTFRLALSCTGEYAQYFGGTTANALAAMNNTMTRVNGVFMTDFSARMVLIANNDTLIYLDASTDPYSVASVGTARVNADNANGWSIQLQNTLTNGIGNAAYDIGHLFGATGGGGNAGCIGCVCVNDTTNALDKNKGSGYTSPSDGIPSGDNFDIDYVAHEMGHQFGGNHTFTHSIEPGNSVQVEPGSGSTIMGYAGITSLDIQPHSDAFFHAISIQQITNNIKAKACPVNTATGNSIPTANAGLDYTIPKSTPFMLTGTAADADGDTLSYIWEQMNNQTSATVPSATKTSGVNFRSWTPTATPVRYFPSMSSVLAGSTTTAGTEVIVEALPSVARTLNFRFTVRDNKAGGGGNNSDDAVITVNATAGPFTVTSQSTATSYTGGTSQTVTWDVAGTTANGVNCANVDILWSTDNGNTWTTILAATPNDGTQTVTIPNTATTTGRIMVKGSNHVFFNVNKANITVTIGVVDTTAPTAPTLSASGTTTSETTLSWSGATDNVAVTGYDVYQGTTLLGSTTSTSYNVTGLSASTSYTFTVKAKDAAGNISIASNTVNVTTLAQATDTTAPTAPTLSASGTTTSATTLSWSGATDNVAVTGYDVYRGTTLLGSTASTSYNVTGLSASTTYTFTVKAKDAAGNISAASNAVSVTTLSNTVTYCTSQGSSTADERIGKVVFGTISNTSTGTAGYENFTSISTNVTRGTAYTITITPSWTSTKFSEGYAVFIDYNGDGDFADSGETVWTKAASTTTPVSGTITIPATAITGNTRMRVSMKYNAIPTSCETFSYGQVEDYTINIVASAAKEIEKVTANVNTGDEIQLYPNPVKGDVLNIKNAQSTEFSIYNASGRLVKTGKIEEGKVNVNNLPTGAYLIKVGKTTKRFIKE